MTDLAYRSTSQKDGCMGIPVMSDGKKEWFIGRAANCDIVLDQPEISARHCRLELTESGWIIEDLNSTNGTFVNGVRIDSPTPVRPEDDIRLANFVALPWDKLAMLSKDQRILDVCSGQSTAGSEGQTPSVAVVPSASRSCDVPVLSRSPRLIRIGRAPDNDVVLDFPTISRYHARLVHSNGNWWIEDQQSLNGTALGHVYRRIVRARVSPQDVIYLGTYRVSAAQLINQSRLKKRVRIPGGPVLLGRQYAQDDPWLSRHVAAIVPAGDHYVVETHGRASGLFVNGQAVKQRTQLRPGDQVQVGTQNFVIQPNGVVEQWNYRERLIIEARDVGVCIGDRWLIRDISLTLFPRELVALMGPSGAGKTTLMMCLCGYLAPSQGDVLFNGESLYENYPRFSPFLGYVPQEDIMHRELTVREALYYCARLRLPNDYTDTEIQKRVTAVISQLGLQGCEDVIIGSAERKGISGGQRKRVNLAMELITDPLVLFLDEPTSGLSSEDALRIVELLRKLADSGKIIIVTIHQPSRDVFRLFDHLILIAKDQQGSEPGQLTYFGPAYPEAVHFFNPTDNTASQSSSEPWPDEILRGMSRLPIGQWVQKYQQSNYYRDFVLNRRLASRQREVTSHKKSTIEVQPQVPYWTQTWTLIRRYWLVKRRDRWNATILLAQAPIIAWLINMVLSRSASSQDPEDFFIAKPQSIFLTALASLWFGCSNAAREIIGEWAILYREYKTGLRLGPYLLSKIVVLGSLCLLQCFLLLLIVRSSCGWESSSVPVFAFLYMGSLAGLAIGLIISSLARTSDMALALLPLCLIPLVILSGAVFPIFKMTEHMRLLTHVIPTRWAYEGLVVLEADTMKKNQSDERPFPRQVDNLNHAPDIATKHFPKEHRHCPTQSFFGLLVVNAILYALLCVVLSRRMRL